ncbi:hypothetical protein HQ520_07350 [bacterium]|nr:hypothetical protein [bacterium]
MSPFSAIGAAQPITATGQELPEKVDRKIISFLKGEVRATAKYKGHPYRICEAFVDPTIEIPGLTPVGEPLTMDQDEATTFYGLVDENDPTSSETLAAFVAVDIEDILKHDGLWPADIHEYEMTWSENLAKFLMGIKALLLLVGIAALYLEVKTPGLGAPAAVGVLALSLFFWGSYLADFARFLEIALFILGILLLLVEIFVIPGFGVAGLAGIALVLVSLVLAMVKLPSENIPGLSQWSTQALSHAIWQVIIVFVALVPIIYILAKFLPATPIFRKLVLNPETAAAESERMRAAPVGLRLEKPRPGEALLGVEGTALTDLRPSGMALIDNRRVDVVTEGGYISAGSRVRVIEVHGNYHVVAEAPQK